MSFALIFSSKLSKSPTTTVLADGYTDDAIRSKYDNYRASRLYSRESLLSNTSLGSKIRFSQFSLQSRDDGTTIDDDEEYRKERKQFEPTNKRRMLAVSLSRAGSLETIAEKEVSNIVPKAFIPKCSHYYHKYNLHRYSASVLLILYSFLGAWVFYFFEHNYEQEVKQKERVNLRMLRNETFNRITSMIMLKQREKFNFEDFFIDYEKRLHKVRLPECLDWDYWGALFYVGTLFTTIGYGNIAPRTALGRAASVIYAIVGIPLVLAILSNSGKWLTSFLSEQWQKHRLRIREKAAKTTNRLRGRNTSKFLEDLEHGNSAESSNMELESRTIPVWLALLICVVYVCICSSLFLLWETRWTFFTSLYFFCISLSTIGLGDIVPDKPHMFIIMFVLVIVGLSIVSMFISVVQIRMEEWLYQLIREIQQQYTKEMAQGKDPSAGTIINRLMEKESPLMQILAPHFMSEQQNNELEATVRKLERLLIESKETQTELPHRVRATQVEKYEQSMACDPMSMHVEQNEHQGTQWSKQLIDEIDNDEKKIEEITLRKDDATAMSRSNDYRDSISDATSLPMDSMSSPVAKKRNENRSECAVCRCDLLNQRNDTRINRCAQTDLAQFQIDEIAIKLANLQTQRVRPPIAEMATSVFMEDSPSNSEVHAPSPGLSLSEISVICEAMSNSMYKNNQDTLRQIVDAAVGKDYETIFADKSQLTSLALLAPPGPSTSTASTSTVAPLCNSVATSPAISLSEDLSNNKRREQLRSISCSPMPAISMQEDETQTSLRIESVHMATDPCTSQLMHRSTVTSPVGKEDAETETSHNLPMMDRMVSPVSITNHDQCTSPIVKRQSPDYDDRSIQTSISAWFGNLLKRKDESQQTSIREDAEEVRKKNESRIDNSQEASLGSDALTSSNPPSTSDDSEKNNKAQNTFLAANMSASVSMSTQYSPPPGCEYLLEPHNNRGRSSSTSGIGTSIFEEESRQEVIVQTDDSYLKIARRLDEYRNNKTQFLPVCAAAPLSSKEVEPFKSDRPSERSHYYFGGRRASFGRNRKKSRQDLRHGESQTGQSMDAELLKEVLKEEEADPKKRRKKSVNFAETTM